MPDGVTLSLEEQVRLLFHEARWHKTAQEYHRRNAARLMEQARILCEAQGMEFIHNNKPNGVGEEYTHGRQDRTTARDKLA